MSEKRMRPCGIDTNGRPYVIQFSGWRDYATRTPHKELVIEGYNGCVMQSTGDVDKNGKEIYEGDVVESSSRISNGVCGKVLWALGSWMVEDDEGALDAPVFGNCSSLTVIGNVHENPELI